MTNYTNSIQQFSITIPTGATSATATISTVGSLAYIVANGWTKTGSGNGANISFSDCELTNTTTVTARRNTSDATDTVIVVGAVIDATSSLVQSVQKGRTTISVGGTSANATITSSSTTLTSTNFLGAIDDGGVSDLQDAQCGCRQTSATNVQVTRNATGQTSVAGWQAVLWASAAIQSIQFITQNYTSGTTRNATITSITTANAMLLHCGGLSSGLETLDVDCPKAAIASATTVTITNNTAPSFDTCNLKADVVEFVSGVLTSVQRGTTVMTAASSNTTTITSVKASNAYFNPCGFTTTATANLKDSYSRGTLTSATVVTVTKGSTTSNSTVAWEVPEFNNAAAATFNPGWATGATKIIGGAF